jgi:hypothetical protein
MVALPSQTFGFTVMRSNAMLVRYLIFRGGARRNSGLRIRGISGTRGFIVGTELVPGALDVRGLKELIARAGSNK